MAAIRWFFIDFGSCRYLVVGIGMMRWQSLGVSGVNLPLVHNPVRWICLLFAFLSISGNIHSAERETFVVKGRNGFVIMPPQAQRVAGPVPWVWYAPTLGNRHPNRDEQWMIDRLHGAGIAIAGIDVGESYGSPAGIEGYQNLYLELTVNRGFKKKPVLLARSRGGLMLYGWAVKHPNSVGGVAGIYPVCNIASYPGVNRAASAFDMEPEELSASLKEFNPVDNLRPLANARVPIFHIQGDSDKVVPHEANTGLLEKRYRALAGPVQVELIPGQGHNMWRGWFESQSLTDFMIKHAVRN